MNAGFSDRLDLLALETRLGFAVPLKVLGGEEFSQEAKAKRSVQFRGK